MSSIEIKSDFVDYYDHLNDIKSAFKYERYLSRCKQRGTALKALRSMGIKTLELKQVNQFCLSDGYIVVYTNPSAHGGLGKRIMTVDEAQMSYSNCVASIYHNNSDTTLKYVQVGKRRFMLYFKKQFEHTLEQGELVDIREAQSEYNRLVGIPIFSIDYVSNGLEMVATDFNEVQNLGKININRYITDKDVVELIADSMIVYNKV